VIGIQTECTPIVAFGTIEILHLPESEAKTKDFGAQLIVSVHLADVAGFDTDGLHHEEIEVRGRREPMKVIVMDDARAVGGRLGETARDSAQA
jgi:hypothetical protein